jgi:hypothetical protein
LIYLVDLACFACEQLQSDYDTSKFGSWAAGLIILGWGARFLSFLKTCLYCELYQGQ